MKRLWIVTSLMLALAGGFVRAQAAPEARIGVFDASRLSDETEEGKSIGAQLTALQDKKRSELAAKQKEIGDLQNQLTTQALSLSPDRRAQMEKDINLKGLELQQLQQKAQNEMQMELQEAQGKFNEKLMTVIEGFGKDEGFSLLLERGLVAYAAPSIDVTTALVDRFNATFKSAKPADKPADKPAAPPTPPAPVKPN